MPDPTLRELCQAVEDADSREELLAAEDALDLAFSGEYVRDMAPIILAALNAERSAADAGGYARAMGEVDGLLKGEAQSAVDKARATNDPTKEGYSMAVRDMRVAIQGLAKSRARERAGSTAAAEKEHGK